MCNNTILNFIFNSRHSLLSILKWVSFQKELSLNGLKLHVVSECAVVLLFCMIMYTFHTHMSCKQFCILSLFPNCTIFKWSYLHVVLLLCGRKLHTSSLIYVDYKSMFKMHSPSDLVGTLFLDSFWWLPSQTTP